MNEFIEELKRNVKYLIERREGFTYNEERLLDVDFDMLSDFISELEDKLEEYEFGD